MGRLMPLPNVGGLHPITEAVKKTKRTPLCLELRQRFFPAFRVFLPSARSVLPGYQVCWRSTRNSCLQLCLVTSLPIVNLGTCQLPQLCEPNPDNE